MPGNHRAQPEVAHAEEYDSDQSETVAGTRIEAKRQQTSVRPSKAAERGQRPGPRDAASDSGYSSHTSATVASAASRQAIGAQQPLLRLQTVSAQPQTRLVIPRRAENQQAAPKPPSRSASTSRKYETQQQCNDLNCGDPYCQSSRNTDRRYVLPQQQQQQQAQYRQVPQAYPQQTVSTLNAQSQLRPRPPGATARTTRPQSYHAGMTDYAQWWQQQQYLAGLAAASAQQGPQLSPSPYHAAYAQAYPQPAPSQFYGSTPPSAGFVPPSPIRTSPSSPQYARPGLPHSYSARSAGGYQPAVISYDQRKTQVPYHTALTRTTSARHPSARHSTQAMPGAFPPAESFETESSESEYSEDERRRDSRLMPPPKLVPSRRPSSEDRANVSAAPSSRSSRSCEPLRRAPRSDTDLDYASSDYVDSDRTARTVIDSRRYSSSRSRRPSVSTTASSGRTKATTLSSGSGSGKIVVEDRHGRRKSYLSAEHQAEIARQLAHLRLEDSVEAYQDRVRGDKIANLTAENIRKSERRQSGSHISAGSHRSRKSSQSIQTEGIQITTGGTTLHILGDAKIEMQQSEDGGPATFIIASSSGKEKSYNNSRSSGSRTGRSRGGSELNRQKNTIQEEDGYEPAV